MSSSVQGQNDSGGPSDVAAKTSRCSHATTSSLTPLHFLKEPLSSIQAVRLRRRRHQTRLQRWSHGETALHRCSHPSETMCTYALQTSYKTYSTHLRTSNTPASLTGTRQEAHTQWKRRYPTLATSARQMAYALPDYEDAHLGSRDRRSTLLNSWAPRESPG